MTWVGPQFSREQVRRAGREFIDPGGSPARRKAARSVVDNWRSAPRFALDDVQIVLRDALRRVSSGDPVVAQRIKRPPSTARKPERSETETSPGPPAKPRGAYPAVVGKDQAQRIAGAAVGHRRPGNAVRRPLSSGGLR